VRIALLGQQQFGKAVLQAFLARGDSVAGVFCAPDKPGTAIDPLKAASQQLGIPLFQLASLRTPEAQGCLYDLAADLGVMAYVLQFAPETFTSIPAHGTIQYHPSLLPRHRGPSSVNWPIILGESETGLTIFRPTDGLDEGPVVLQKRTAIGSQETSGQVYFGRLFPMGVEALLEASLMIVRDGAQAIAQEASTATYEGWCRAEEARINWHHHADRVFDLIRGCDPAPGAWTLFRGRRLQLFDAKKIPVRTFAGIGGSVGAVAWVDEGGLVLAGHGANIEIKRVRYDGGAKQPAGEFCRQHGIVVGSRMESTGDPA
jgi:methionyl-tRNA formyltransferase